MTYIPQIVSEEAFIKCQRRLEANRHKTASFKPVDEKYLLTGKIFCGQCGDTMSGISGTGKDNSRYRYYQCMTSKRHRCSKNIVPKAFVEGAAFESATQILTNKEVIDRISDTCYSMQSSTSSEMSALRKQQRQNKKEIDNLMKAIKAGLVTKSTKAELEKLEEEQERIEIEITKEQIARPIISRDQIEAWGMNFAKTDLKNEEQKQRLIDIFINSVHVYDDKIVVLFNYKDGERCVSFDDLKAEVKKENTQDECSTLFANGDPYGN